MVVAEWAKITSLLCFEKVLRPEQFDASGMVTLPLWGPPIVEFSQKPSSLLLSNSLSPLPVPRARFRAI